MQGSGFILVLVGVFILWLGITGRFDDVMQAIKGAVNETN